jgi:carbon-monoxide dehydrogenase medium subunit
LRGLPIIEGCSLTASWTDNSSGEIRALGKDFSRIICFAGDRRTDVTPKSFEYHAPGTVAEAVHLAGKYGSEGKILAGGQSLVPLMKLRLLSPGHVIDLGRVAGLEYVRKQGDFLLLGAMTKMADVEKSALVLKHCPVLAECASHIADPLVRNMGTIGGNISHADPTNDMPAVMVATEATLVARSSEGPRSIPAKEFFVDTFTTALREGEVLVEAKVPLVKNRYSAYVKLERQAGDFGVVGVAARLDVRDGNCEGCGVALTGVGPTVVDAKKASMLLVGTKLDPSAIRAASKMAAEESSPTADLRGSVQYKKEMVKVMTARAIEAAASRMRRST